MTSTEYHPTKKEPPEMMKQRNISSRIMITAGHARAAYMVKGSKIKVINTHGTQVVDCWAFNASNTAEIT